MTSHHVAVLGGGIQGICTALELDRRGYQVTLLERDERLFNRASLRSEGKIHLGLIYAVDASLDTARRMAADALEFGPVLNRLTGGAFADVPLSAPFLYLVPSDSMLTPAQLEHHYAGVASFMAERLAADPSLDYLGHRPSWVWRRLTPQEAAAHDTPLDFLAAYDTEELSIDLQALATVLCDTVRQSPRISVRVGHAVRALERSPEGGFLVVGDGTNGVWRLTADQVVNALWEHRMVLDATLGVHPPAKWVHRLKYRLLVRLPEDLRARRSVTYTLGPYGDVVIYRDGTAYVSWYPACRLGWSTDLAVPAEWEGPCRGEVPADRAEAVAQASLTALDRWIPGLRRSEVLTVDAGAIVAWGGTEIVDPTSGLHLRSQTGVHSYDGYHSIDTGKLTNAPHFAVQAADAVARR